MQASQDWYQQTYRKFLVNFSATKIHEEFQSCINAHSVPLPVTQYYTWDFLSDGIASETT